MRDESASTERDLPIAHGWALVAAILCVVSAFLNLAVAIAALVRSANDLGLPSLGPLWLATLVWAALGLLMLAAALVIMSGLSRGLWFAIPVTGLDALLNRAAIPSHPWLPSTVVAVDLLAILALLAHRRRGPADIIPLGRKDGPA